MLKYVFISLAIITAIAIIMLLISQDTNMGRNLVEQQEQVSQISTIALRMYRKTHQIREDSGARFRIIQRQQDLSGDESGIHYSDSEHQFLVQINRSLNIIHHKLGVENQLEIGTNSELKSLEQEVSKMKGYLLGLYDVIGEVKENVVSFKNRLDVLFDTNGSALGSPVLPIPASNAGAEPEQNEQHLPDQLDDDLTSRRLDCFDDSKCLVIRHTAYGRSGNRLVQLGKVESLLSKCSGAALSPRKIADPVVRFPTIQLFGRARCRPAWDRLPDVEAVFARLHACQSYDFSWFGTYPGINCSLDAPAAFQRLHLDPRFPAWLDFDLAAWARPIPDGTAVLHFRGGDIFQPSPHASYTQPVCDHYLQAARHSRAACALLVAEDDANPCVAVAEARLNCTVRPPACGPACAFALLARARVLVASVSTFVSVASGAFAGARRRIYSPYCGHCPRSADNVTRVCVEANRTELSPWDASARQLELLVALPARVVDC